MSLVDPDPNSAEKENAAESEKFEHLLGFLMTLRSIVNYI
jgi:hypothetical protein